MIIFELEELNYHEYLVEFWFLENYVYQLSEALLLSEKMKCYNGIKFDRMEDSILQGINPPWNIDLTPFYRSSSP